MTVIFNYIEMFNELFIYYKNNINNKNNSIYLHFLKNKSKEYLDNTNDNRKVIDYIAGMTDNYMNRQAELVRTRKKTVR